MSKHYGLRITTDAIADDVLQHFISSELILAVRETGSETEKPHYHLLFYRTDPQLKTLKQYVIRKYPGGNEVKAWTRAIRDKEAQLRYLCKGTGSEQPDGLPSVAYNVGIDVPKYHAEYWRIHDELQAKKAMKTKRPLDACYDDLSDDISQFDNDSAIGKRILLWHVKHGQKPPGRFDMPRWILLYKCRVSDANGNLSNDLDTLYESFYGSV